MIIIKPNNDGCKKIRKKRNTALWCGAFLLSELEFVLLFSLFRVLESVTARQKSFNPKLQKEMRNFFRDNFYLKKHFTVDRKQDWSTLFRNKLKILKVNALYKNS